MFSMGRMRKAPSRPTSAGMAVALFAAPAPALAALAPPKGVGAAVPGARAGLVTLPPLIMRMAFSTSWVLTCLSGNTPTDMPLSRSTSKVLMMSSQPSIWGRVPVITIKLRSVSTRTTASAGAMARKMVAISLAPMFLSGMTTAPWPGGKGLLLTWRKPGTTLRRASGRPMWNTPRVSRAMATPLACSAASSSCMAWSAETGPWVDKVTEPLMGG